jgi:multiple antibiotic resistance protein
MTHQALTANLDAIASAFMLFYAGLFPIVNPVGGAPIFLGLTRHCSEPERNKLALRVTINCFFLLLGSMLIGSYVLDFFGITLPIVRVAGGLVVTATAWNLLQTGDDDETPSTDKPIRPTDAFYPLTMPITVGPGTIAVAIALGSQRPRVANMTDISILGGSALAGVFAMAVTIYVCYRFAEGIVSLLGKDGTDVVVRLSAFILMCIGIEIIWNGYAALMNIPH